MWWSVDDDSASANAEDEQRQGKADWTTEVSLPTVNVRRRDGMAKHDECCCYGSSSNGDRWF